MVPQFSSSTRPLIRTEEEPIEPSRDITSQAADQIDEWTPATLPATRYQGWVESALSPFTGLIDISVNPRDYYVDLQEIAEGPGGTTLYVARLADPPRDDPMLPAHIKEQDQQARLAHRTTIVAIKSVPILPSGNAKLGEVLRELSIMHDLRCENILKLDSLYVDAMEDALWIRMEFMTRSLSSVIELSRAGLSLPDKVIAGCTKDILSALEYLRVNDITPKNINSSNVLINNYGVLKLSKYYQKQVVLFTDWDRIANLSTAVKSSWSSQSPTSPGPTTAK
ncbi:kinase-like domain-containing protein [Mycena galopus ATCC 62051]|nr:kinase-like domain-containing protein [Mycena galopus ATCC 62051]